MPGLPNGEQGQCCPDSDVTDTEIERLRPEPEMRRHPPGGQCTACDGDVPGKLVQSHRESTLLRTNQVDLHDNRRRPGQTLTDTQQHVRGYDPVPSRRPH